QDLTFLSLSLCFITEGHCLSCYECNNMMGSCAYQKEITCGSGSRCMSDRITTVKIKGCGLTNYCTTWSLNFGSAKGSSLCCDTDLCNGQNPPDSSFNGQKCYYCDEQSCSNILSCSGSEDRCFELSFFSLGSFGGHSMFVKGCVSKAICNATTSDPIVRDMSCCEGHLCNHPDSVARKTTQSFLLLCCSLLSFVLLH
uniref:UPAR/Ly6 domain-containing protein n=1 Tax=Cyprinus carpio TaxID=7962 RepID=A0A8C2B7N1_CYPCA